MNAESLKKSILQCAIEGKLVPQLDTEPNVEQIGEEPQESPFEIPNKWKWVRLKNVGKIVGGGTPKTNVSKYWDNGTILWITPADLGKVHDLYVSESSRKITEVGLKESSAVMLPKNTVLFSSRAPIGHIALAAENCCTNQGCKSFVPNEKHIDPLWGYYVMKARTPDMIARASGTTFREISGKGVGDTWIPLPPLHEQQRIVGKLGELLPLVDIYGREQEALERLEKELPGKLRASILQEAIQGKLVPQLDEEPDVKQIGLPPEDVPFAIPEKWKWVTIGSVCDYIQRGKSPRYSDIQEIPVVAQKCNQWDGFHIEKAKFIDPETVDSYKKERWLQEGDVLWNSTGLGTLGRVALYEEHLNPYGRAVADSHVTVLRSSNLINSKYLYFYICSSTIQSIVEEISSGSTKQKELATTTIKELFIPLPPILEQHRIVDRIVQLLDDVKNLV